MRKLKVVMIIGFVMLLSNSVKAQGIDFFHGTFTQAQVKAQKEGKHIFIDFYTTWCGPCKIMAKKYFTLKSVGDVYNKKFICLKVDAEKGEGIQLAKQYGVSVYPTLVFTNEKGKLLKLVKGMHKETQLIELVK